MFIKRIKHFAVNVYLKDGNTFEGAERFDIDCLDKPKIISGFLFVDGRDDCTLAFSADKIDFFSYAPVFED